MSDFRCPSCSGPIRMEENSSTVVCPYCSTTVQVKTGERIKESYVMRLQFGREDASERMLAWTAKQLGAPRDLIKNGEVKKAELVFWPFWVVEVEANGSYEGTQKKIGIGDSTGPRTWDSVKESRTISTEQDILVPASTRFPKQLGNYVIPTKRKEFFQYDLVREAGGTTRPIVVDQESALRTATAKMHALVKAEALKELDRVERIDITTRVPAVFLVHVPIWHITYRYRVRRYKALVGGAAGTVIYAEYPRRIAFRAMLMMSGLLHLAIGGGLGLVLVYVGLAYSDGIFPTIVGIVWGLGMIAFALRFLSAALDITRGEEMVS
ncbi:MAG: hypothetical protein HXY34_07375 [Candidatus Thorarchaeota archaeon]|nr:hypothetical protein [Candidatus Thorarchaeota archaeon]